MTTIRDIARESGYSVSTVSRALSGRPDVSATARARIADVVSSHDYVANTHAQNLKRASSATIAVMVKGRHNQLFASVIEKLHGLIQARRYTPTVEYVDEDANELTSLVRFARHTKPAGVVFLGGGLSRFEDGFDAIGLPGVVVTDRVESADLTRLSSVFTDDVAGAAAAVDHLVNAGHRHIGIIGGDPDSSPIARHRLTGASQALAAHGLSFDPAEQLVVARYAFDSAYTATRQLIEAQIWLTALFCMSDVMAVGAMRALADCDFSVPAEVSVIGFDGLAISRYYVPRITTISQDQDLLAQRAAAILFDQISGTVQPIHEVVPFSLLNGESVGPAVVTTSAA